MKFYITFLVIALFAMLTGCGGTQPATNQPSNANSTNTELATNSNDAMVPVIKAETATTNNAPTIAPVVAAYYEALQTKNDDMLKGVLTAEHISSLEADMKEEKQTKLTVFLAEFEQLPKTPVEVRNEQITGDKAVAEVKGGTYANWTKMIFVKEGDKWKWSGGSPDTEGSVAKPANGQ